MSKNSNPTYEQGVEIFERAFALARTITEAKIDDGYGGTVRLFPNDLYEAAERLLLTSGAVMLAEGRHLDAIKGFFAEVHAFADEVTDNDD